MNNLAPMKNCPGGWGVQGNLNWSRGNMVKNIFSFLNYFPIIAPKSN